MATPADVVLVLDIGTSSGRAALVDRTGAIRSVAARRHSLAPGRDGTTDIDGTSLWGSIADATRDVVREAAARSWTIHAVSTTSVRGAFVVLGADDGPVWGCGSLDSRGGDDIRQLARFEPAFHAETGQRLSFAALPRLRWLARERPELWQRARCVLTLDAWLVQRLSGARVIPVPAAAPTGLLCLERADWLVADAETPWHPDVAILDLLPELARSGSRVGEVTEEASAQTGTVAGLPVAAGGGDAQLATLGLASIGHGDVSVVMGSHWQAMTTLHEPLLDSEARFRVIHGPLSGTWQADTIAMGAGLRLDQVVQPGGGDADNGDPAATAEWRDIVAANCRSVAQNLALMESALGPASSGTSVRVGGGASRSDFACQILADAIGRPVERGRSHQASLLGGAVCAGVAAGWYPDLASGARAVGASGSRFEPEPDAHPASRPTARSD